MKLIYIFTEKEQELIKNLACTDFSFTYSREFDELRKEYALEINSFREAGLIYHANRKDEGAYVRFSPTEKGFIIFDNVVKKLEYDIPYEDMKPKGLSLRSYWEANSSEERKRIVKDAFRWIAFLEDCDLKDYDEEVDDLP